MTPIHDVDLLLLLAVSMAAKRRPAEALDIVAAIDLIQKNVPNEDKLVDAFQRLGSAGLMQAEGGGVVLSAAAQAMIEALPRKAETAERLFCLRDALSMWTAPADGIPVDLAAADLRAALLAHRASASGPAKNLLMPKPAASEPTARPGQRKRKPLPGQRRR